MYSPEKFHAMPVFMLKLQVTENANSMRLNNKTNCVLLTGSLTVEQLPGLLFQRLILSGTYSLRIILRNLPQCRACLQAHPGSVSLVGFRNPRHPIQHSHPKIHWKKSDHPFLCMSFYQGSPFRIHPSYFSSHFIVQRQLLLNKRLARVLLHCLRLYRTYP